MNITVAIPLSDQTSAAPPYQWAAPVYAAGQRVTFWWREGIARDGKIAWVETRYRDGVAQHAYVIRGDGHRRYSTVGHEDITNA